MPCNNWALTELFSPVFNILLPHFESFVFNEKGEMYMGGNITCDDIQAFDILKLPFFCCHSFLTLNNKYSITLVYLSVYSKGGPHKCFMLFYE